MTYQKYVYTLICFYLCSTFHVISADEARCQPPKLENGRVREKLGGRVVRFNCISGFTLAGSRSATCRRGGWSFPTPVCIKLPCPPIVKPTHSLVIPLYNGAYLMFLCEPGYERIGSSEIYCNGRSWNATAPTCTKYPGVNPPTSCDFEKRDLCSWTQDPFHDFDWVIQNFNTSSWHISTGPSHDHTLGQGRDGYYLYIEADDKLENSTARIMSPLYSSDLTNAGCFSFWYHMYGETVGTLNVYFKLEGEANRTLKFTKSGNQGNHWWHGFFNLPKANSSFQLIVEGVRGASYQSDIALDDVAILQGNDCIIDLNTTTEIITTDADTCDKSRCKGPVKYYEGLGCTPIYSAEDSCCAVRYNCDHLKGRSKDKCYYKGHVYEIDEALRGEDADPCDIDCTCNAGWNGAFASFSCAEVDCFDRAEPGCYLKESHDCCAGDQVCTWNGTESIAKCEVDGKTYLDGKRFTPKSDPTLSCICGEDYKGENVAPFCVTPKPYSCNTELSNANDVYNNCPPAFYSTQNPATECNIFSRCQNDNDTVLPADATKAGSTSASDPDFNCSFGNLTMKIGDELNQATGYSSVCLKCVCEVPPMPTCQRLPDEVCDVTVHPKFDNF